jgi:hypothetical protein
VQQQNGFAPRLADRAVMQAQLSHQIAAVEAEVAGDESALLWRRMLCGRRAERQQQQRQGYDG